MSTTTRIKEYRPEPYFKRVDVANRENVLETAKKVQNAVGDVTILINNAGIMPCHSFLQHTETEIRRVMDINVLGNIWVSWFSYIKITTTSMNTFVDNPGVFACYGKK